MILCIENSKDSTKEIVELISEFSKVTRYTINIQISVAFFKLLYYYSITVV